MYGVEPPVTLSVGLGDVSTYKRCPSLTEWIKSKCVTLCMHYIRSKCVTLYVLLLRLSLLGIFAHLVMDSDFSLFFLVAKIVPRSRIRLYFSQLWWQFNVAVNYLLT